MYNNNDVDNFLLEARENKEKAMENIEKVSHGADARIIRAAISNTDFVAEDFDRYDSDVCEQFLILMQLVGIAK